MNLDQKKIQREVKKQIENTSLLEKASISDLVSLDILPLDLIAQLLGRAPNWVRRRVNEGTFRAYKLDPAKTAPVWLSFREVRAAIKNHRKKVRQPNNAIKI